MYSEYTLMQFTGNLVLHGNAAELVNQLHRGVLFTSEFLEAIIDWRSMKYASFPSELNLKLTSGSSFWSWTTTRASWS